MHTLAVCFGEALGESDSAREILADVYVHNSPRLAQRIAGIDFSSPIGLAAGFDYEARLTQILASLEFGFQTAGTITNFPYGGNPPPMLRRLPEMRALLINKGFKNLGADETVRRLQGRQFPIPLGISIGRTNAKKINSQKESIADIVAAFTKFEKANLGNSYYELNISCPNLFGTVSFYPPKNLDDLLKEIDSLKIARPIFVKMPISESNRETAKMLEIICLHSPAGVIIGNLHKNPNFKGGLSGKPTVLRSNELISLTYRNFGQKLVIIGCGGVFNAQDAFEKITRGASLIQLITGLVFEGPQLVSEINQGLGIILKREGLKNISAALGSKVV